LQLLYPVVEIAMTTDAFAIMLWQHDGFSIAVQDNRRLEDWKERIQSVVKNQADALGIYTELEEKR
jgi:hypothetical protein